MFRQFKDKTNEKFQYFIYINIDKLVLYKQPNSLVLPTLDCIFTGYGRFQCNKFLVTLLHIFMCESLLTMPEHVILG